MTKRLAKSLLTLILIISLSPPVVALTYRDIPIHAWYTQDLVSMIDSGILEGYVDGTFRPEEKVKADALFKILCHFSAGTGEIPSSTHEWARGYHDYAYSYNWIDTPMSNLSEPVTRLYVGKSLLRSLGFIPTSDMKSPFADTSDLVAVTLYEMGIMTGTADPISGELMFYPNNPITRAEFTAILNRMDNYLNEIHGVSDFRYRLPQVKRPEKPELTSDYFNNALNFMMANEITEMSFEFSASEISEYTSDDVFQIIIDSWLLTRFLYHEYGSFYGELSQEMHQFGGKVTYTVKIHDNDYTDEELSQRRYLFFGGVEDYANKLYKDGIVTTSMTDEKKAFNFYRQLALDFSYDTTFMPDSYLGYGLLYNDTGVCQAYVSVFNALCKMSGIEVYGVSGIGNGDEHVWSLATLDGRRVFIDPTFADPIPDTPSYFDDNWFGLSYAELLQKGLHTVNSPFITKLYIS